MTPTKERIENWRAFLSDVEPEDGPELNAISDLALLAVALKPRPIEEAPDKGGAVLIWPIKVGRWTFAANFDEYHFQGGWKRVEISHFIPLSALSAMMEVK